MNRKKIVSVLLSLILAVTAAPVTAWAEPVPWPSDTGVQSRAGIVMDMDSGAILFRQNSQVPLAPASIVKVLTALVVIENASLEDTVTFSHDAVYNVEDGSGNKASIEEGDEMTVRDCLYLMLLVSSNQAANALAEHVAGSREAFVEMMNRRAEELGCANSHFANPSGLNDETQLTTAYDMAIIGRAAYENPTLLEISSAGSWRLPATANNPDGVTVYMEHQMLDSSRENYYPYAVAGKTGYTSIAGQTLITYAVKEDRRLIAVTLNSTEFTHYSDTISLMDFGFNSFQNFSIEENEPSYTAGTDPVELGGKTYDPSDLSFSDGGVITLPRGAEFADAKKTVTTELDEDAPQGAAALLSYQYEERNVGEVYLISASLAESQAAEALADQKQQEEREGQDESEALPEESRETSGEPSAAGSPLTPRNALIAVAVLVLVAIFGIFGYLIKKKRDEERRRMEERRRRRRQRLEEIGCTQEEFDRLMEERSKRASRNKKSGADGS